ncbi:MAG TPA: crosslink repair DNA glycosylase YcaQ family protein [Ornithinibacter sp.]|nr:crosslink repair DNA glycosylase YcaQ family protein [Ornithinibacter sp.]HQW75005.1 crosslink repair DNA glycosylase YcaQ family protein [Ornithinibacter sp.]HQX88316.1 crosslink repair DNA glycosylase YcaQ family protein [Ornithinibacter sp.]
MTAVRTASLPQVRRRRLATQRLSAAGLPRGGDVVRLLTAVQSQDAPLAAWSLAMRMPPGTTYAGLLAEQAAGGWVRTHVLRPTWHHVAPEDLRWMQHATGPRVESSLNGRRRGLGLDDDLILRAFRVLERVLAGPTPHTRRELRPHVEAAGLPTDVQRLAHLLIVAELRAFICSGPPRGAEHTYVLADETLPPAPLDSLDADDGRRELTRRFVAGHGPASERDLARWSTLTLTQIRAALRDLEGDLDHVEAGGHTLWFDPRMSSRTSRAPRALLLSTFDEVCLTYRDTGFPRRDPSASRARLVSEAGGGIVVVGDEDVGVWKRVVTAASVRVAVSGDTPLDTSDQDAIGDAAAAFAAFLERPLDLTFG